MSSTPEKAGWFVYINRSHILLDCVTTLCVGHLGTKPFEGPLEDVSLCEEEQEKSLERNVKETPDDTKKRKEETDLEDGEPQTKRCCSRTNYMFLLYFVFYIPLSTL